MGQLYSKLDSEYIPIKINKTTKINKINKTTKINKINSDLDTNRITAQILGRRYESLFE